MDKASVFRTEESLAAMLDILAEPEGPLRARRRRRTRARCSTTTSPRPRARLPARPGRGLVIVGSRPAPRAAARTGVRTIPLRDDANWMKHTLACARGRWLGPPRLQGRRLREVPTHGTEVLTGRCPPEGEALRPRSRQEASLAGVRGRGRFEGPRARRAARGEVAPRRHAHLPPLVRPRRVRLRRDDHQRRRTAWPAGS